MDEFNAIDTIISFIFFIIAFILAICLPYFHWRCPKCGTKHFWAKRCSCGYKYKLGTSNKSKNEAPTINNEPEPQKEIKEKNDVYKPNKTKSNVDKPNDIKSKKRLMKEQSKSANANYKAFLSYRKLDTQDISSHIYDRLQLHFGKDNIFIYPNSVPYGTDFMVYICDKIPKCDYFLVIIGDRWLEKDQRTGKCYIENEEDYVRIEIEKALQCNIKIIPVLVHDAKVPNNLHELPKSIQRIFDYSAAIVKDYPDFDNGIERLIKSLEKK